MVERVVRPAVRPTWRRQTWLTVRSRLISFNDKGLIKSHQSLEFSVCPDLQESKRVCAGRPLQRSTPTRPASTRLCARASRTCSRYQVGPRYSAAFHFSFWLFKSKNRVLCCSFKMVTSTKMQSTTCATVSPATSSEATRLTTREESRPGTTPCPLDGAASPSGERTASETQD